MRWSKEMVDSFDFNKQIEALKMAKEVAEKVSSFKNDYEETNKEINKINKEMDIAINGFSGIYLAIAAVVTFLVVEFIFRIVVAIIIYLIIVLLYSSYYSSGNKSSREANANRMYAGKLNKLLMKKQQLEYEMSMIYNTDEGYNARLVVPDDMLYPDKVQALINIVSSRRTKNIYEAIDIYKKNIV